MKPTQLHQLPDFAAIPRPEKACDASVAELSLFSSKKTSSRTEPGSIAIQLIIIAQIHTRCHLKALSRKVISVQSYIHYN